MLRKHLKLYFLIILAGMMMNCNSSGSDVNENLEEEETKEESYGQVLVDNLRLRTSAGVDGDEITQIGKNQIVTMTGQKTDYLETISMRGKEEAHPWYEVSFNGDTGWVYGAGIQLLAPEDISESVFNDFMIIPNERVGNIGAGETHFSLVSRLSEDQVIKDDLPLGEGEFVKGTVIYPNSNNEVLIYWQNEDFENIRQIVISKPGSDWHVGGSIHVGTSIEEVMKVNGRPFEMTGFDWDYGGTTLNWQGGNLHSSVSLVFDYTGEVSIYPFLVGDKAVSSDNSSLLKLKPRVQKIIVSFN